MPVCPTRYDAATDEQRSASSQNAVPVRAKETQMLISDQMKAALTEQIGHEFAAMLQYVTIATYFESEGLPRLAQHFYRQAEEEREHAMRFVHYVVETGGEVAIPVIPAVKSGFGSAEEAVQLSLDQELMVTRQINALMDQAIAASDHAARTMLEWFVTEQVEEVSSMETLLRMIQRAGETGLLFVESYLAQGLTAEGEGAAE
jgi:bacterioferritin B